MEVKYKWKILRKRKSDNPIRESQESQRKNGDVAIVTRKCSLDTQRQ